MTGRSSHIESGWTNLAQTHSVQKRRRTLVAEYKLLLNMVAIPPPRPVVLGELKKVQSGGESSEKAADSPTFIQVSVTKSISRAWEGKKSLWIKVLFTTDLTFTSTYLVEVKTLAAWAARFTTERARSGESAGQAFSLTSWPLRVPWRLRFQGSKAPPRSRYAGTSAKCGGREVFGPPKPFTVESTVALILKNS